ncbi:hypothetical protein VNO77_44619 [Canavalia gladiata]|uniref:Partial AB-hydrolase lipase domain-containing protein n=1 Tax=Canavalia gladiata TaxID=3824 RepID=A0AAN9JZA6_CANGL
MANTIVGLFLMALLCITVAQGRKTLHPNNEWPTSSKIINDGICKTYVETQGYTCEEHEVTTEDGYILSLQRIPAGRSGKKAYKQPVLLQHGLTADAICWLFNSQNESLGFILADSGYDVWLANARGTKYSRGHRSLSPNDMGYWNWSWEELSSYDLPTFVQYVYSNTGKTIHYTGHSLGTLMALAAFSQGKALNMLRTAALLAPIAHMNQITSPVSKLAANTFIAEEQYWLGVREFVPNGDIETKFLGGICRNLNLNCANLMTLITVIRSGQVRKYDHGPQNVLHYGQLIPPIYDITKIPTEFPLFIGYGGQDALSDVNDVHVLLNDLKDHNEKKLVVLFKEDYGHLDFIMSVLIDNYKENEGKIIHVGSAIERDRSSTTVKFWNAFTMPMLSLLCAQMMADVIYARVRKEKEGVVHLNFRIAMSIGKKDRR